MDSKVGKAQTIAPEEFPRTIKDQSWIDAYSEYAEGGSTTPLFAKWAAIGAVAMAMGRRCWTKFTHKRVYPTMYIVLLGQASSGKSQAVEPIADLHRELGLCPVAPDSMSAASLLDVLSDSKVVNKYDVQAEPFHSLNIINGELGDMLQQGDFKFMKRLESLWDTKALYSEKLRSGVAGGIQIQNPQVNILGGIQPKMLLQVLPERSWDSGLTARMLFVYQHERRVRDPNKLFPVGEHHKTHGKAYELLKHDLEAICHMHGYMPFSEAAQRVYAKWYIAMEETAPHHHKLVPYNERRDLHLARLCMVISASENQEMVIEEHHVEQAIELLAEIEHVMPAIFVDMYSSDHGEVIEGLISVMMRSKRVRNRGLSEAELYKYLSERLPSYSVENTLKNALRSEVIKEVKGTVKTKKGNSVPAKFYEPDHVERLDWFTRGVR